MVAKKTPPNNLLEAETEKKVRVQLDFESKDIRTINQLVVALDLGTRAELFRSAIRVLRWMAQKKAQGCDIVAITEDNRYFEPEFEFFDVFNHAARKGHSQNGETESADKHLTVPEVTYG